MLLDIFESQSSRAAGAAGIRYEKIGHEEDYGFGRDMPSAAPIRFNGRSTTSL